MGAFRRRDERGASAVEFALVMPLLFLLLFGIIAFGFVFAQMLSLSNAAREAARYGVVEGRDCGEVKQLAKDASATVNLNTAQVSVQVTRGQTEAGATPICASDSAIPCAASTNGDSIFVRLDYESELIIPVPTFGLIADPLPISGSGVFRCEFN